MHFPITFIVLNPFKNIEINIDIAIFIIDIAISHFCQYRAPLIIGTFKEKCLFLRIGTGGGKQLF